MIPVTVWKVGTRGTWTRYGPNMEPKPQVIPQARQATDLTMHYTLCGCTPDETECSGGPLHSTNPLEVTCLRCLRIGMVRALARIRCGRVAEVRELVP